MLNLSEISTPDGLSLDGDDDLIADDDSADFEERRRHKKYSDYMVKLKKEP